MRKTLCLNCGETWEESRDIPLEDSKCPHCGWKPMSRCICGEDLTFLMDNKVRSLWQGTRCGRLLLRDKDSSQETWYVPEMR